MVHGFETDYIGKNHIVSSFSRCDNCKRLTLLNSYTTRRFVLLFNLPFLPLGKYRMIDECSHCGQRGTTSAHIYGKERKSNLAIMMNGFAEDADCPDNCCHALRTLMIYGEEAWFDDIHKSYGLRFETDVQVQHMIAKGFCRFNNFEEAISHSRKAIVLGGGKPSEELLEFCQSLKESTPGKEALEALRFKTESAAKAYIPLASVAVAITLYLIVTFISSFRTHRAWLVNGSLQQYSFTLDDQTYLLAPGNRQQIKLKLGSHHLQVGEMPAREFTYSTPLIKQLFLKHLLVINPDAMALLSVDSKSEGTEKTIYSHGKQIHVLSGVNYPLFGFQKQNSAEEKSERVSLYRPPTHVKMLKRLAEIDNTTAVKAYARRALIHNPATTEAASLLDVALFKTDFETKLRFLQRGLSITPALLPWHLRYQDLMMNHPSEDHSLILEYTERCKEQPDESENFYLLGRVLPNRSDAHKFFEHSEKGRGMNGLGYHAIARDFFIHAEFKEALEFSSKSIQTDPAHKEFAHLHEQILLALRNYDALLNLAKDRETDEADINQMEEKILYLTCAGYHQEAEAEAIEYSNEFGVSLPRLNAVRFYAVGNMSDYLACLSESGNTQVEFQSMIQQNQLTDADEFLLNDKTHIWWEHLVLYCASMTQDIPEIAERHLAKAISEVDNQTHEKVQISELLSNSRKPTENEIKQLDIGAQEKALLCATLGFRFPADSNLFNTLALQYNFNPTYPQLNIRKWCAPKTAKKKPVATL